MDNLFLALLLLSIIGLLIGLIMPKIFKRIFGKMTNRKTVGLIFGGGIVLFFILFGVTAGSVPQSKPEQKSVSLSSPTSSTTPEKSPEVTPTPQPTKEETTIMDRLWVALDNSMKTRDKYDISYDEQKKLAIVTRRGAEYWDETAIVKTGYSTLIEYGQEAFKIVGVDEVEVILFSNFTDQYGKSSEEKAVDFAMKKDEFNKYDWNGLKGQNIFNQMTESCSVHYIHPAIFKNLKTDKLIYI